MIFSWDETDDTIYIILVGNQPNISDDTETVFPSNADLNESKNYCYSEDESKKTVKKILDEATE